MEGRPRVSWLGLPILAKQHMFYVKQFPAYNASCVAALQVMLLSDGSVTRHLQLLTDLPVQVVSSAGALQHLCMPMCIQSCLVTLMHAYKAHFFSCS